MLRSAAASWTLFFGLLLIMAGNGLQVVLLGIEATGAGFSKVTTGFVMAGYFLGIFLGSLLVPKLLDNVSHVRVFGAMAALASAAVLVVAILVHPAVWAMMRIVTGFCFAGMYIVCESWLNDKSTNETRGQMLSLYMIVSMGGMGIGQMLVGFGGEQSVALFLLASVLVSIAVVPILLTAGSAPGFEAPERMSMRRLVQVSPLAVIGLAINGVAVSMMFGMGAVYGRSIGMDNSEVGYFMTAPMLGAPGARDASRDALRHALRDASSSGGRHNGAACALAAPAPTAPVAPGEGAAATLLLGAAAGARPPEQRAQWLGGASPVVIEGHVGSAPGFCTAASAATRPKNTLDTRARVCEGARGQKRSTLGETRTRDLLRVKQTS